jgi:hypothetical protein
MTDPLAAIEARHAAATKGPLVAEGTMVYVDAGIQPHVAYFHDGAGYPLMDNGEANADLFAHSWQDIAYLLARVRTAEGRVADLETRLAGEQPIESEGEPV